MNPLVAPESIDRPARTALSVNLNKVALLRNTRHLGVPDVVRAATLVLEAGGRASLDGRASCPCGRGFRRDDRVQVAPHGLGKAEF
ncbi:MAG TPA: pyridoxine 5'-phosphate synthase, partial [Burkholderiaceae bacterium]|nr:pyridoxine 5'-phosphate synthase [Burkholderiaceae bacterium]